MSAALRDALRWEASYQCWCRRVGLADHPSTRLPGPRGFRNAWARAAVAVRVQQAERWLRRLSNPARATQGTL